MKGFGLCSGLCVSAQRKENLALDRNNALGQEKV